MKNLIILSICMGLGMGPLSAGELSRDLVSEDASLRQAALNRLFEMDNDSKKKIIKKFDAFLESQESGPNPLYMVEALGRMGPEAIPVLAKGLSKPDYKVRAAAADELGNKGAQASEAVPRLISQLNDSSFLARTKIIRALGKIGLPPEQIETALIPVLEDRDEGIRAEAVDALGMLGPSVQKGVKPLQKHLKKDTWNIQWKAAKALGDIGSPARRAIPTLIDALYSDKEIVRNQARISLVRLGPAAVPALKKALKTKHRRVKDDVIKSLEEINSSESRNVLKKMNK